MTGWNQDQDNKMTNGCCVQGAIVAGGIFCP